MKTMRTATLVGGVLAALAVTAAARGGADEWGRPGRIVMEYVGQVVNGSPTPASSRQFGNLRGVAGSDESRALTFYTQAVTVSTAVNGPLRIVDRTGATTIYAAEAPGSFEDPGSFRSGTPVQVSALRQQVIVDTSTGLFTVVNINDVTAVTPFRVGDEETKLGQVGDSFRTQLTGRLNTAGGQPTGWFGGYAMVR